MSPEPNLPVLPTCLLVDSAGVFFTSLGIYFTRLILLNNRSTPTVVFQADAVSRAQDLCLSVTGDFRKKFFG
jgi:hypothetical protein